MSVSSAKLLGQMPWPRFDTAHPLVCMSFQWPMKHGHGHRQLIIWKNYIIQCNYKCRCRVGVRHDICPTSEHA